MYLHTPYRYYTAAFSDDECDTIINMGKNYLEKAGIGHNTEDFAFDFETRNCHTSWINEKWIYEKVYAAIWDTNKKAGWEWEIDTLQPLQFTKYGVGEYYDWHVDNVFDCKGIYNDNESVNDSTLDLSRGKTRKISVTVNLVDGDEYDGGDLIFSDPRHVDRRFGKNGEKHPYTVNEVKVRGTIIVFPSFNYHKVTPVTRGTRYSLVAWALGPPWK